MIDFNQIPKVDFEEMNNVHEEEVQLLNTIEEALMTSCADENRLQELLDELFIHTKNHFANEERLMKEVGFPAYMMHKSEHDRALNEFQFVVMDWRNKKDNGILQGYFLETIPQWLHQHIASMDTMTARFICMQKGC